MSVTQVQATKGVTTTATTLTPTAWTSAPVAGNLLIISVKVNRNNSAATSCSTPSGWNSVTGNGTFEASNGTRHIGIYYFWRLADGNNTIGHDAAPPFTLSANTGSVADYEEWNGLDTTAPFDAVGSFVSSNTTSATITPSVSATAGDLVLSTAAGVATNVPTLTWGGGSTTDKAAANQNSNTFYGMGSQIATSTGTVSPTINVATITGTGLPIIAALSITFKASGGAPPAGTIRKVRQGGAWVTATRKVRQGGAWVAATRKIRQSGTWV